MQEATTVSTQMKTTEKEFVLWNCFWLCFFDCFKFWICGRNSVFPYLFESYSTALSSKAVHFPVCFGANFYPEQSFERFWGSKGIPKNVILYWVTQISNVVTSLSPQKIRTRLTSYSMWRIKRLASQCGSQFLATFLTWIRRSNLSIAIANIDSWTSH